MAAQAEDEFAMWTAEQAEALGDDDEGWTGPEAAIVDDDDEEWSL
jgi:hypothetical protein